MTIRHLTISAAVLAVICAFGLTPASAEFIPMGNAVVMEDLIAGGLDIIIDDKKFSDFTYLGTGDNPGDDRVNVQPGFDDNNNNGTLEPTIDYIGLRFQGGFIDLPGNGASDVLITYNVMSIGNNPIVDAHLTFNGEISGAPPSGFVGVTETFVPRFDDVIMNVFNLEPGPFSLTEWVDFSEPILPGETLPVQKDIILIAGDNSAASISFIDQTYSQIPEPAAALLAVFGLAGMGLLRRK